MADAVYLFDTTYREITRCPPRASRLRVRHFKLFSVYLSRWLYDRFLCCRYNKLHRRETVVVVKLQGPSSSGVSGAWRAKASPHAAPPWSNIIKFHPAGSPEGRSNPPFFDFELLLLLHGNSNVDRGRHSSVVGCFVMGLVAVVTMQSIKGTCELDATFLLL